MPETENTVMVLEPNRMQRDLIRMTLQRNNLNTVVSTLPDSIREDLARHEPDLILMEIFLPSKNGLELMREMKKEGLIKKDTKFFVITSLAFPEIVHKSLDLGAVDFLVKPINMDLLVSRIKRAMNQ